MAKGKRLVILCEDLQHEVFARCYFTERGFGSHEIIVRRSPKGKGSGAQYVREQYPKEVKAHRSRVNSQSICLAVMMDADNLQVSERVRELDQALAVDSQRRRSADESIAVFVPRRNIETWIHYLEGESIDEDRERAYPKLEHEADCRQGARKLAIDICPKGLPEDAPQSLQIACEELKRILP